MFPSFCMLDIFNTNIHFPGNALQHWKLWKSVNFTIWLNTVLIEWTTDKNKLIPDSSRIEFSVRCSLSAILSSFIFSLLSVSRRVSHWLTFPLGLIFLFYFLLFYFFLFLSIFLENEMILSSARVKVGREWGIGSEYISKCVGCFVMKFNCVSYHKRPW